ncbi:phage tail fiber protein [Acinetobacter nosocomialis]|uniref:phage tail fiber protein n=1 Tax=Acinetobacter nosocomialis TaxID=106654 RepID=UPI00124F7840|nr:hypothetical protein [Acinetobacter nosocomialis]
MTIQTVNLGTAPTGAGGDTFRSTGAKINENFTNNNHAASRYVGTAAGNVMEVGAFGVGTTSQRVGSAERIAKGGFYAVSEIQQNDNSLMPAYQMIVNIPWVDESIGSQIAIGLHGSAKIGFRTWGLGSISYYSILHSGNTTVDANGFIKAASPIIKLFTDKIEPNDEAAEQPITFEKRDVGHYLLKGTSGFATEGWYIETPKDANGNILFAVIYQQLENKDIEIKTFKKKFDVESASIIADLDNPVDISTGRWIDIRLQEIPKPVPEIPVVTKNDPE